MVRRFLLLLMLMPLILTAAVRAEDEITVDLSETGDAVTSSGYIRVSAELSASGPAVLSVFDPTGALVYQRAGTAASGRFLSDSIYLPLTGMETVYTVQLQTRLGLLVRTVRRLPPRLTGCRASACGCPLSVIGGSGGQNTATILDLTALSRAPMTVALQAGGTYMVGTATFRLEAGSLIVSADPLPGTDVVIDAAEVQVALTSVDARALGRREFAGPRTRPGEPVDVSDAPYAAVYLQLTVSFSPAGLPTLIYSELTGQRYLWELMQDYTAMSSNG